MNRLIFATILAALTLQGCLVDTGDDMIRDTGTIRFIALEGGFYGIVADGGMNYDPVNLAEEFKQDTLRVRFTAKPAKEQVDFHMWGRKVELIAIEKL
ncbi:MAG: hypothetical protein ACRDGA_04550 [Bacteroidota bacterium]